MSIAEVIDQLRKCNIKLSLDDGGDLRVIADKGTVTDDIKSALKANKEGLVAWIRDAQREPVRPLPRLEKAASRPSIPLSYAQERLWLTDRMAQSSTAYNINCGWRARKRLDGEALLRAVTRMTQRHETLRTAFHYRDGAPVQEVQRHTAIDCEFLDLRGDDPSGADTEKRWAACVDREMSRGFDLERPPLFRVRVYRVDDEDYIILFCFHHIIFDGWSMRVLLKELDYYYDQYASSMVVELEELPIQYTDFAVWQREPLTRDYYDSLLAYWRTKLQGWERLSLLHDGRASAAGRRTAGHVHLTFDGARAATLKVMAKDRGVTLFTLLLAVFYVLLYKHSGQRDLTIGTDVAARNRPQLEKLIGFFVNQVVLRQSLQPAASFDAFLQSVKRTAQEAYGHQDVPFNMLVDRLLQQHDAALAPFFSVKFIMLNFADTALEAPQSQYEKVAVPAADAKFEMTWSFNERGGGLALAVEFDSELFEQRTVRDFVAHYDRILGAVLENPERPISLLDIAGEDDRRLYDARNEAAEHPRLVGSLAVAVESWARRTPDATAVADRHGSLTYSELNARANQLARCFLSHGVRAQARVGVCMESGRDYVLTALAISKAGATLLPLDHRLPQKRIAQVIQDASLSMLVSSAACTDVLPAYELNFLRHFCIDERREEYARSEDSNLDLARHPQQIAYLVYTSGTSGKPKGAMITEAGLGKLVAEGAERLAVTPQSRMLQFSSIGFDASIWEIMTSLGNGAALYCDARNEIMPGIQLARYINEHGITHLTLPPSALEVMPELELPSLQTLILAGEKCNDETVRKWRGRAQIYNAYGPSEATVCATIASLAGKERFESSIGVPIRGCSVYIIGADGGLVPIGVPGELCIGGASVGSGYWQSPAATADKFVPDPFSSRPGARLYRTGDRARYRPDGEIRFLGRTDKQIKLRGYRIEPGDIEQQLLKHPRIRQAVVVVPAAVQELCAFVVPAADDVDVSTIKSWLRERLPEYMVPAHVVPIQSVPVNVNGKLDIDKLPPIGRDMRASAAADDVLSEAEARLRALWQELLKRNDVGKRQNFFDVGGNSLLLVGLQERMQQELGKHVPIAALFKHPTIETLAAFLAEDGAGEDLFSSVDERLAKRNASAGRRRPVDKAAADIGGGAWLQ